MPGIDPIREAPAAVFLLTKPDAELPTRTKYVICPSRADLLASWLSKIVAGSGSARSLRGIARPISRITLISRAPMQSALLDVVRTMYQLSTLGSEILRVTLILGNSSPAMSFVSHQTP